MIQVRVTQNDIKRIVRDLIDHEVALNRDAFLDAVGRSLVAFLRSYTGEWRPGVSGGPARPAHPGHWADITHELESSYGYRVTNGVLYLYNTSGHAVYLENRDGYFVLRGIGQSEAFVYAVRLGLKVAFREATAKVNPNVRMPGPPAKATTLKPLASSKRVRPRAMRAKRAGGPRPKHRNR